MSLSSLAEDSALRLTTPAPDRTAAVTAAADAAAKAAANGEPFEDAHRKGIEAASATAPPTPSLPATVLNQLVSFIPTETILLYVAGETAFGDVVTPPGAPICRAQFAGRWWWLAGVAVGTALLCAGLSYRRQREINQTGGFRIPWLEVAAATAAFMVWALSLASTPLRNVCGYDYTAWSPVLLLGGTITIASLLYVFRATVNWEKTVSVT